VLADDPEARRLFLRRPSVGEAAPQPLPPGERLRQGELAATLRRIASEGERGFYEGPVAEALLALMRARGGLIDAQDLRGYRARLVEPLAVRFRGHPVLSMPPPGGGLSVLQLLRLVEPFDWPALGGGDSAASLHRLAAAMALVFRDRNSWLGDPEQVAVPVDRLLGDPHLERLRDLTEPGGSLLLAGLLVIDEMAVQESLRAAGLPGACGRWLRRRLRSLRCGRCRQHRRREAKRGNAGSSCGEQEAGNPLGAQPLAA
jgi:gamma-glutamyltranspeptidase